MNYIELTNGGRTLVDDEDFDSLNQHKWYFNRYVRTNIKVNGIYTQRLLHRMILDAPKGLEIDHINRNPLDNRKKNLRICTHSQNILNSRPSKRVGNTKFIGIWKANGKWRCAFRVEKKRYEIGTFDTERQAALARDMWVINTQKEFAILNFIPVAFN